MATQTEIINDALQQSTSAEGARGVLAPASLTLLRALCDLNHLDVDGSRKTLTERLIAEVHAV